MVYDLIKMTEVSSHFTINKTPQTGTKNIILFFFVGFSYKSHPLKMEDTNLYLGQKNNEFSLFFLLGL